MKCTNCQAETIDSGDIHCRKIFKEKFELYLLKKDLFGAENLIKITKFNDPFAELWKNEYKKVIANLKRPKPDKEIKKQEINRILLKIKNKELLTEDEIKKLNKSKKYECLGYYHYNRYQIAGDPWELSKACSFYRDAGMSETGIKVADKLKTGTSDKKALAAVLTSKGGAFKDLRDLGKAKECAYKAIELNRTFYPYTLLGAVYILEENFEMADESFQEATKLGAIKEYVESEIQKASVNLSDEAKEKMELIFNNNK